MQKGSPFKRSLTSPVLIQLAEQPLFVKNIILLLISSHKYLNECLKYTVRFIVHLRLRDPVGPESVRVRAQVTQKPAPASSAHWPITDNIVFLNDNLE